MAVQVHEGEVSLQCRTTSAPDVCEAGPGHVREDHSTRRVTMSTAS